MKRMRMTEVLTEIKANLVAFFSVCMFVCLGIGLFLGIQWGGTAIKNVTEDVFEAGSMHDIEVQFPYGLTDDDVKQLKKVDGVSDVEVGYTAYSSMMEGSARYVMKFQSLTDRIDKPVNISGKLPVAGDEVALLRFWAEDHDIELGDKITLKKDAANDADEDGMEYLNTDTFAVTALVDHPAYLSKLAGALGPASIGSGDIDCVAFVAKDAFDITKFKDSYPTAFLRCDGLRGKNTFSSEYQDASNEIAERVTELGGNLATKRYNKLYDEARGKVDDVQKEIDEANQKIAEGETKYADSEKSIGEGEQQLADAQGQLASGKEQLDEGGQQLTQGKADLANAKTTAQAAKEKAERELASAKSTLDASQSKYDENLAVYDDAKALYDSVADTFNSVSGNYDVAVDAYNILVTQRDDLQIEQGPLEDATNHYMGEPTDENWPAVQSAYDTFAETYANTRETYSIFCANAAIVLAAYGLDLPVEDSLPDLEPLTPLAPDVASQSARFCVDSLSARLEAIGAIQITIEGTTYHLSDVRSALDNADARLSAAKQQLDDAKQQLDAGWAKYNAADAEYKEKSAAADAEINKNENTLNDKQKEYDQAKTTYQEKLKEYETGEKDIEKAKADLEEARKTLDEKEAELSDAKAKLDEAREKLKGMKEYEWIVLLRLENGGVSSVNSITGIMGNVRWAMALLFVLVGLFVCYSAVSRLVNDEVTQIGAKKALGFREREITFLYLSFSGASVLAGTVLACLVAVLVVQGVMNPVATESLTLPACPPYFNILELLLGGVIELVLIMLASWLAIHSLLKLDAIVLLNGNKQATAKAHAWEKTKLWKRMSLFSQTVVNNCVNDKRRVIATLIGVAGCTALIVTAVTLRGNVAGSYRRQYDEVYDFDTQVFLDTSVNGAAESVTKTLDDYGLEGALVHEEKLQVRQPNGYRTNTTLFVPMDQRSFNELYHLLSIDGSKVDFSEEGIWISAAYAEHMNAGVGDEVRVTEGTGKSHEFTVAGVFEYYLLHNEFVLSKANYVEAFGEEPTANVILTHRGSMDVERLREALVKTEGYSTLIDDYATNSIGFNQLASVLNTVVAVYLMLSALMALVVLLNLDIMFVGEKKRELIVLLINGYSTRNAKAYIYRDSIVLTAIGIVIGVVFGAIMGSYTIAALEPSYGYFLKGVNLIAVGSGVLGSGVFSMAVLFWSLRMIPRFDLTDINRF